MTNGSDGQDGGFQDERKGGEDGSPVDDWRDDDRFDDSEMGVVDEELRRILGSRRSAPSSVVVAIDPILDRLESKGFRSPEYVTSGGQASIAPTGASGNWWR